jgi:hypothetical protein
MDLSLHSLVQLLHARPGIIHLLHEILAAQSAQSAATTSADAHGVPAILDPSGHVRSSNTIWHRTQALDICPYSPRCSSNLTRDRSNTCSTPKEPELPTVTNHAFSSCACSRNPCTTPFSIPHRTATCSLVSVHAQEPYTPPRCAHSSVYLRPPLSLSHHRTTPPSVHQIHRE